MAAVGGFFLTHPLLVITMKGVVMIPPMPATKWVMADKIGTSLKEVLRKRYATSRDEVPVAFDDVFDAHSTVFYFLVPHASASITDFLAYTVVTPETTTRYRLEHTVSGSPHDTKTLVTYVADAHRREGIQLWGCVDDFI